MVHAIEKFHVIPWLMIEFGFCALWSFFFFTAALAFAVKVKHFSIMKSFRMNKMEMHLHYLNISDPPLSPYVGIPKKEKKIMFKKGAKYAIKQ